MSSPGTSIPSSGPPATRTRDWVRSGEPGSAFRGLSRGRSNGRGGGSGNGRGGRGGVFRTGTGIGGHAENLNNILTPETLPAKAEAPIKPTSQAVPVKTPEKAANSSTTPSRPKHPSKKVSRNTPTLVIDPSSPATDSATPSTLSRSNNRRRRSHQQPKATATAVPKLGLSSDSTTQTLLHPRYQRSRSGPSSPVGPSNETSPHLSAAPYNIDALVERVRAVAMADNRRPTTPGSHIDWAGDDDDSLPDLDDWGVTTTGTSAGEGEEEISPIMVDGLKPLPEPAGKAMSPLSDNVDLSKAGAKRIALGAANGHRRPNGEGDTESETISARDQGRQRRRSHPPRSLPSKPMDESAQALQGTGVLGDSMVTPKIVLQSASVQVPSVHLSSIPPAAFAETKTPLHPSLPAKPVAALHNLTVQGTPENAPAPVRSPTPVQPCAQVNIPVGKMSAQATSSAVEEGLAQSIHAPRSTESVTKEELLTEKLSPRDGLVVSIHIPENTASADRTMATGLSETVSDPNLLSTAPYSFNPTHRRAHTTGRQPTHFHHLPTAPAYMSNERFSRSGASTPRGTFTSHHSHSRTHSTPPSLNHREFNSRRPVITGDAISRLARTIGTSSISPARSASVAASAAER